MVIAAKPASGRFQKKIKGTADPTKTRPNAALKAGLFNTRPG